MFKFRRKVENMVSTMLGETAFAPHSCENCGSNDVHAHYEDQAFIYGAGADSVDLRVTVPVWSCRACGMRYTDEAAEIIRHDAVCVHLGRLTPRQLVGLRFQYGLTQEEFANISNIGIASIKRWESGNQIQSSSFDSYLRLLSFSENMRRISEKTGIRSQAEPKFRTNLSEAVKKDATTFNLRLGSAVFSGDLCL